MTAIIRARSEKAVPIRGMLLQVIAIGLVAAATVILFSIASFSIFETRTEPLTRSGTDQKLSPYSIGDTTPAQSGTIRPFLQAATPTASTRQSEVVPSSSKRPPSEPTPLDDASSPSKQLDRSRSDLPAANGLQQNEPAERDQADLVSDGNAPEQNAQGRRASGYALDPQAAFRYRVKKECGPIINDPALYRHCVSTFGVHYR